ncbi:3'5'-cyclic nucleotide phosphodiesterase, conserved site [Trema orientale]|uniref:3'5'-cyclic nucleotide phosphodiesterase, conserved site n=1 Tax=Trema orientale TaxID=63057 RepID=A0A2P5D7A7_TREOI|nr:3'5'-cyclic nucleotide phosphodiesterase, conserved site [Trema orientale]
MDVAHILLGRPWFYDHDVQHCGKENTYTFLHGKKTINLQLAKSTPRCKLIPKTSSVDISNHGIQILIAKPFERECINNGIVYALVAQDYFHFPASTSDLHSSFVAFLLKEFIDIIPTELSDALPPMRDIQHAIDLVPSP